MVRDEPGTHLGMLGLRLRTGSPFLGETLRRVLPGSENGAPQSSPEAPPGLPRVISLSLEATAGPLGSRRPRIREGSLGDRLWRRGERSLWVLEGSGFDRGRVLLNTTSPLVAQVALRQFLRAFVPEWLLWQGGLVLHGATLLHRGKAWVFLAPSGGGKTTLARTHGSEGCLGDDGALLWRDPAAGRWWSIPSPLSGREHLPVTASASPLGGLLRLRKVSGTGTGRCSPATDRARGLREVLARSRLDVRLPSVRRLLLDRAIELVRDHPLRLLWLPRDLSPWNFVDRAFASPDSRERP